MCWINTVFFHHFTEKKFLFTSRVRAFTLIVLPVMNKIEAFVTDLVCIMLGVLLHGIMFSLCIGMVCRKFPEKPSSTETTLIDMGITTQIASIDRELNLLRLIPCICLLFWFRWYNRSAFYLNSTITYITTLIKSVLFYQPKAMTRNWLYLSWYGVNQAKLHLLAPLVCILPSI